MAIAYKFILQQLETGDYITETGFSSDITQAKMFSKVDLESLPTGSYVQTPVWSIS